MSWFKSQSVSVTNGSDVVKINDGSNTAAVKIADALVIGGNPAVEIKGVFATELRLASPWAFSSVTNSAATVMPTGGDFRNATEALRNATTVTSDNFKTLEAWGTEMGVVIFKGYDNSEHQSRTMKQMDADVKALEDRGNDAIDQVVAKYAQPESTFRAQKDEVKQVRSGSAWDEWGKHSKSGETNVPVNQGLWAGTGIENALQLGIDSNISTIEGVSKTGYAKPQIDGVKFNFNFKPNDSYSCSIKLPPPADGTQVTDTSGNVRGSGKPKLDLKVDVDPKYNDVAADKAEAQSRAFEGLIKNGDFRNGTASWSTIFDATFTVSNGIATVTCGNNQAGRLEQRVDSAVGKQVTYEVVLKNPIGNDNASISVGGVSSKIVEPSNDVQTIKVSGLSTVDGYFRVHPSTSNNTQSVEVYSFRVYPITESVITTRQDLSFIESWEEVMGSGTGEKDIYCPNGLPQYGATSFLGIPLVDLSTTSVGLGYAKFGEWQKDADVVSKVAVWSALSLDNKKKVIDADPNMYFDSVRNKPVCARARGRTIEGLNDSWDVRYKASNQYDRITCTGKNSVRAQGKLAISKDYTAVGDSVDADNYSISPTGEIMNNAYSNCTTYHAGQWRSRRRPSDISDGDDGTTCVPLSITQRLNDGAWHPSYNPWGTAMFDIDGVAKKFHELTKAQQPKSQLDCFLMAMAGTGLIASGKTGRYDQYPYADAIYAGMVHDLRLSSHAQDTNKLLEDFIRKAVSGTSRGKGKVPFTNTYIANVNADSQGTDGTMIYLQFPKGTLRASTDDTIGGGKLIDGNGDVYECSYFRVDDPSADYVYLKQKHNGSTLNLTGIKGAGFIYLSPEFDSLPYVNIIGDPVRIAAAFPDGCIGEWLPQIPPIDSTIGYSLTRDAATSSGVITFTDNDGESWTSISQPIDKVRNVTKDTAGAANFVGLIHYESLSDPTEAANNSAVVGGVGDVATSCAYGINRGGRLHYSLTGNIGKDDNANSTKDVHSGKVALTFKSITQIGTLQTAVALSPKHVAIDAGAPANDSPAVKALYTLTEKDGLLYGQFHGCSMSHDGTDWGDDGKIPIVNKEGTKTDDNGVTQKTFCHHTKFPLGIASYNDSSQSTK